MADSDVAVSVGDQLPMLLKNSAYTVDANLQKHTRAPPRTRSGRFQSTLSVRRATATGPAAENTFSFQSTLSVRRATTALDQHGTITLFQSTLSVRRATFSEKLLAVVL